MGKGGVFSRLVAVASFRIWLTLAVVMGGIVALGVFTLAYTQGASYLSDNPKSCVNCHVMRDVYDDWNHSGHKAAATCNDCHIPHSSPIAKWTVKGWNGVRHSVAFTLGNFPERIQITSLNQRVTQGNCIYCHEEITAETNHADADDPTDCLYCHAAVGHPD